MATGFNNTPPVSEFHRHKSWGRTRGPKNIVNPNHTTPQGITVDANGTTAAYDTENQRYLHVNHTVAAGGGGDDAVSIQLQVYMHASGLWANLGDAFSSTTTTKYECVEIKGVDRVRFVVSGITNTEECTIFPACSTF